MDLTKRSHTFKWLRKTRPDRWDEELLFGDGDTYFTDLLSGLRRAKTTVTFETYIFERGWLADQIARELAAASERGVKVQVLIDGLGSPAFWRDYGVTLEQRGVHVHLFRVWPWQIGDRHQSWRKAVAEFFRRWRSLNRGNHRKTCLVDDETAWISSCNVADVHLRSVVGDRAWLDVGVRVRGPELKRLQRAFKVAYKGDLMQSPFQPRDSLLFFNSSLLLRRTFQHHQLRRMRHATEKVWLQTPYFVPVRPFFRRMIKLARQGVDVRLMVPATNDVPLIKTLSYAFFKRLLRAGVRIFEFQPRFMHQKISQIDKWVSVGSSNLNHRSFFHDLEIDVVVTHTQNQELLRQKFLREQEESREVYISDLARQSLWSRALGRFLLLLRYWS